MVSIWNEWPWALFRGRLRLCLPMRHIRHWISRKSLEIDAWLQMTTNRKWHCGGSNVRHVTDDVTWPWKVKLVTVIRLESDISKTAGDAIYQQSLITRYSRQWCSTVDYPSNSLASCITLLPTCSGAISLLVLEFCFLLISSRLVHCTDTFVLDWVSDFRQQEFQFVNFRSANCQRWRTLTLLG